MRVNVGSGRGYHAAGVPRSKARLPGKDGAANGSPRIVDPNGSW